MANRRTQGKRTVYNTGFVLNLFSLILQIIAFASPYWFQSWPRVHSTFKNIGLWESCFAGINLYPRVEEWKTYYGCWWILSPYYWDIQTWMMPWWFVITQVVCTLVVVLQMINVILGLVAWVKTKPSKNSTIKKRPPIALITGTTILTIINAIALGLIVILFGTAVYVDRVWMPRPDLNYLSWSYGLEVVASFFLIFASMALGIYNKIVRQELREPPSLITPMVAVKDSVI
jgi:hypothetical protein